MKLSRDALAKALAVLQLIFIVTWLSHLVSTDSYFSVYALCGIAAVLALYDNFSRENRVNIKCVALGLILSLLLSLAVTLSNYTIFQRFRDMELISYGTNAFLNVYEAALTFVSGIAVFYQIFLCIANRFPVACREEADNCNAHPRKVFWGSFALLTSIYLIYLFLVVYPGSVTSDSIWQINQIVSNNHTNHHPYWHTMSIKYLMAFGYWLFKDTNAAAATFNVFQSMAMAGCFAYAVVTLYEYKIPKIWVWLTLAVFACLPNHITYSCTVWKDVPFGGAVLLLVIAMFRVIRNVDNSRKMNYAMLIIGGIATCIFRSNGWYAMLAAFVVLALFFRKRCKELLVPWLVCLIVGYLLTGPVLSALGVAKVNFIEGLSVPLQQVARVIANGGELTEYEYQQIDTILNIEDVPLIHDEQCVDSIKDAIRMKNYPYLQENKGIFFKIWLDIGMRYPWEYVEAWVEQTKGYWNGGYDYYIYAQYVSKNNYGMYMVEQSNLIHDLVKAYFTFTRETVLFEPVQSIGFNVWILSILCFFNLMHNRKEFLLTVPVLAVVFTLWLTTPVFSEFRYAYCVFTTLPFILPVSLFRPKETKD